MSTQRKWLAHWSMGYCGTDTNEIIDLIDDWGWDEEQLEDATDKEIEEEIDEYAKEEAMCNVEWCASPATEEDIDNYS